MNKVLRIGITGGIGCGKSTVAQLFKLLKVPVYDADSRAKWLMANDSELTSEIESVFGKAAFVDGQLNRTFLANKVFTNEKLLDQLNSIVHPVVARDFNQWSTQFNGGYLLKEAALLFEAGSYKEMDANILVISPIELRLKRIGARDSHRSQAQIEAIISQQMAVDQAKQLADHFIYNDEQQLLIPQVLVLDKLLEAQADT